MQVKKDEVKNALLKSGEIEFLEKGYEKASIRKIVKKAGTTIGNFYNYFPNKEALFEELIKDEYSKFMYFIMNHDKVERPDYLWEIPNPTKWREVLSKLISDFIPNFERGFVILLDCSEGTKYENSKDELINLVKDHYIQHMETYSPKKISIEFANIMATQFIQGFIAILRDYEEVTLRNELITEHILFYMIGAMGMLGDFKLN